MLDRMPKNQLECLVILSWKVFYKYHYIMLPCRSCKNVKEVDE